MSSAFGILSCDDLHAIGLLVDVVLLYCINYERQMPCLIGAISLLAIRIDGEGCE